MNEPKPVTFTVALTVHPGVDALVALLDKEA